ncbi:helix-turn-helix transcriptional regulator [Nakamurella leprariae]
MIGRPLPTTSVVRAAVSFLSALTDDLSASLHPSLESHLGRTLGELLSAVVWAGLERTAHDFREEPGNRERVRQFVHERLHDPDLDVAVIATGLGISRRYVHRLFEAEELTVSTYIRSARLDQAARLLREDRPDLPLSDIAMRVGFHGRDQFSRAFRLQYGTTPRDYRARYAGSR